jgi:hypothetical protein
VFKDGLRADLYRYPMSIFVQVESHTLLWLRMADSHRHRTEFAIQAAAPLVAAMHNLFQDMPDHVVRQMPE